MENQINNTAITTKSKIFAGIGKSVIMLLISLPLMQFMPSILYLVLGKWTLNIMTSGSPIAIIGFLFINFSLVFLVLNTILLIFTKDKSKKIGILIGYLFCVIPNIIAFVSFAVGGMRG